jgi:hypothetical protein
MPVFQSIIQVLKAGKWIFPLLSGTERDKRGPGMLSRMKLLALSKTRFAEQHIRVSIAYLFRIKIDSHYLLIKGRRIDQYQPVGGVYKYHPEEIRDLFNKLDVRDDMLMPIDDHSRDDLRIRVPGRHLLAFIDWFNSEKNRETDQQREFYEELVQPGYLSAAFSTVMPSYRYTVWQPLTYSPYCQAQELMVYQVYDLRLTPAQKAELSQLQLPESDELRWVSEAEIMKLGADQLSQTKPFRIGRHACFLLSSKG